MTEAVRSSNLAVFFDYENFARSANFDVGELLSRLKERGRLVIKRAYADWGRFANVKQTMMRNAVELIELPSHRDGKNRADIKLVVDAMEVAMTKDYIDTIVIASGDSDFIPLVAKLRELNRYVIVISSEKNSKALMAGYCDELIYYASLPEKTAPTSADLSQAAQLMGRVLQKLDEEGTAPTMSVVKQWMRKLDSSFTEADCGFSRFKRFLQCLEEHNYVRLEPHKGGDCLVRLPGSISGESSQLMLTPEPKPPATEIDRSELRSAFYWASHPEMAGTNGEPSAWISLSLVGSNMRKLFPDLNLRNFGLPKKGGLYRFAEQLQAQGLLELDCNLHDSKQYMLRKTDRWEVLETTKGPPQVFEDLRLNLLAHAAGYSYDRHLLAELAENACQLIAEFTHIGQPLSLEQLFAHLKSTLARKDGSPISSRLWSLIARTVVAAGVLQGVDGLAISPASLPPDAVIVVACLSEEQTVARVGEFIRQFASQTRPESVSAETFAPALDLTIPF